MEITLFEILSYLIPALTGIVGWLAGRKKRNNDFLKNMQDSIDLLSKENKDLVIEVVELRKENAQLLQNQTLMQLEIESLNKKLLKFQ